MRGVKDEAAEMQRLRWQCRRGMLELDFVLERFLETSYGGLNGREQATFARLLDYQDQDLHDWVMGRAAPVDGDLRRMVAKLRAVRW
jgi:antitoxin CptB